MAGVDRVAGVDRKAGVDLIAASEGPLQERRQVAPNGYLGEFEQMVLLAILQCRGHANAYEVRRELEASADRSVSKGAFYTTLDRMEAKGYLTWVTRAPGSGPSSLPQRHFTVTSSGIEELRRSRSALMNLWRDLDEFLETP